MIVDAIIPALDEEGAIGGVVAGVRDRVRHVIVVDNGSRDRTAEVARDAGAQVVAEARRGYGSACLRGIAHCAALPEPPEAVVFLDGDGADDPAQVADLI